MEKKTLSELSKKIENDDAKAFREVFDLFYTDLVAFSQSILMSEHIAEDIVENVLIKLWENRKTLGNINNLSAYLFTATKYASINSLKAQKNTPDIDLDKLDDNQLYTFNTPESAMIGKESMQQIENAVNGLPPRYRLVFYLIKEKGLTSREVAKLLNTSPRTVETQLYHSLKKISAVLEQSRIIAPRRKSI